MIYKMVKHKIIIAVVIALGLINGCALADERVSFLEKLRAQEEQERAELLHNIDTMTGTEYRTVLAQRLERSWNNREIAQVRLIMDVSAEKVAAAGRNSKPTDFGVNKIRAILQGNAANGKSGDKSADAFQITELRSRNQFSSPNKSRHFEQITATVNRPAANRLIHNPSITDFYVEEGKDGSRGAVSFTMLNTEVGRLHPADVQKIYDPQFIKDGHYKDLKESFKERDLIQVSVAVFGEVEFYTNPTDELEKIGDALIDEVLTGLDSTKYVEIARGGFYVRIECGVDIVDALYQDDRVKRLVDHWLVTRNSSQSHRE